MKEMNLSTKKCNTKKWCFYNFVVLAALHPFLLRWLLALLEFADLVCLDIFDVLHLRLLACLLIFRLSDALHTNPLIADCNCVILDCITVNVFKNCNIAFPIVTGFAGRDFLSCERFVAGISEQFKEFIT